MAPETPVTSSTARRRNVFGLIAELLSIHRPLELQNWTPEDVVAEIERNIEAVRQRPA
ncbi:MAG: hypothetical protein OXD37_06665 [Acidimicrobiaceae bacterium]|nr:hypothetical protein [Acidimicrobiaceae bacterium]